MMTCRRSGQRAAARTCRPGAGSDGEAGRLELDARQPQHLGRAVDAERLRSRAGRTVRSFGRAGADIDQAAERSFAQRIVDRPLDLAFGDMERADLVPHFGVAGEIAVGGFRALGADRRGPRRVGGEQRLGRSSAQRRRARTSARRRPDRRAPGTPSCLPCAARARRHRRGSSDAAIRAAGSGRAPAQARPPTAPSPQQREDAQPGRIGERPERWRGGSAAVMR